MFTEILNNKCNNVAKVDKNPIMQHCCFNIFSFLK